MEFVTRKFSGILPYLHWPAALVLSGLSLFLALRGVSLPDLAAAFQGADGRWVLLALLCVAANTLAKAWRWKMLMGPSGRDVPWTTYLASLLAGQALNTLYPARVGDLARAYDFSARPPGAAHTLGSIVLEKLLDLLAYVALALLLLVGFPLPEWLRQPLWGMLGLAGVFLAVILGVLWGQQPLQKGLAHLLERCPPAWRQPLGGRLQQGLASFAILRSRGDLLGLAAWTVFVWLTALLNNHLILGALGISLPFTASLLLLLALTIGISLPSVPARLGIFEYTCQLALAAFGVPATPALGYGVLLHAVVFLPSTLLGLVCLAAGWGRHSGRR